MAANLSRTARAPPRYGAVTRQTHRAKLRQIRQEEARQLLPPLTTGLVVLHAVAAIGHIVLFDGTTRWILAGYAAGLALVLALIRLGLATPRLPPRHAFAVSLLLDLAVLTHLAVLLFATADPRHATFLMLFVLGAGFAVVSFPATTITVAATLAVYAYAWVRTSAGGDWPYFAALLVLSAIGSFVLTAARRASLRRTLDLRLRDEHHMTSMARATRAATESEVRFRRLAEAAFEALLVHDNGRILDANEAAAALIGAPRERLLGHHLREFPALDAIAAREAAPDPPTQQATEVSLTRADGRPRPIEVRSRTLPYRGTNARVLALRDLSETRALEAERLRLAERLQRILGAAGEGVYGLDIEGRVTFVNPAALRMLGYREDELLGHPLHALIHDRHANGTPYPVVSCPIHRMSEGDVVRADDDVFWRRDGTAIPVEYTASAILERGDPAGTVVVFHDVSERREVERMKDELIGIVSHELKTPLTSIHGSLRLLAGGRLGGLPPQARRMVDIAESNTARLMRLISDILDIERLEAGHAPMHKALVETEPLVQEAIDTMHALAQDHQVILRSDLRHGTLWADRDRILQALTNLLSNAIKHAPEGSTVETRCTPEGTMMRFEVRDHGPGIPPEHVDHIFQRFHQVDASDRRQQGGTGLGLAITQEIVQRHDGALGHTPREGGGSIFWFTVPLAVQSGGRP